jgi:hypothetical protein
LDLFSDCNWCETDIDRWESKGKFVPSNKGLIAKTFSVVLDRKAFPVSEWQKITMPVLMIHGGDSMDRLAGDSHLQTYRRRRAIPIGYGSSNLQSNPSIH